MGANTCLLCDKPRKVYDEVEKEYLTAINGAVQRGDNDEAYDLNLGLKEYREHLKA